MRALEFIKKTFSLDDRSMGLYRILIGLVVMADVISRCFDFEHFYTDVGIIPRSIFTGEMTMPWSFSLHLANGSYPFIVCIFVIHFIFGFMMSIGYKTRWATLGAYILTVSVHNRNWLVNNGGDDVLRAILLFSIFLPLSRRFSIESAMQKKIHETKEHFSTWGLTFFLQVFVIYFVSYILKTDPIWRRDFTALFYSTRLDVFSTPLGFWIRDYPFLMKAMTFYTIYLEWFGPLILIFSFFFGKRWWIARSVIVSLFISFHFGIFLTMNIGLFTFVCMSMWTILYPGILWDKVANFFEKKDFHKLTIFYDGECGFCQKMVRILKSFFLMSKTSLLEAQSSPDIFKEMQKRNSWVVVNEKKERFFHFGAFVELLKHSPVLFFLAPFFESRPIMFLGNKIYHWVSNNRPVMGKVTQFLDYTTPKNEIKTLTWLYQLAGAFIFITLLMWNLGTIKKLHIKSHFFSSVTRILHIYQEWNMFAPFPKTDNIWVEIPGVLSDGTEMDVLYGDKDIWSIKSQKFPEIIPNEHWRKFYLNLSEKTDYARYYGGYLCRQWNDKKIRWVPDTTLRKLEIIIFSQQNLLNGDRGGIIRKMSWKHWCFDEDYKKDNLQKK